MVKTDAPGSSVRHATATAQGMGTPRNRRRPRALTVRHFTASDRHQYRQSHNRNLCPGSRVRYMRNNAMIANNGTFDIQGDNAIDLGDASAPMFVNSGTLRRSISSGTATIDVSFASTGTVSSESGTLNFTRGYSQGAGSMVLNGGGIASNGTLGISGGKLSGSGLVSANLSSGGETSPGLSPGTVSITKNYTQTAGSVTRLELGGLNAGTGFDQIQWGRQGDVVSLLVCARAITGRLRRPTSLAAIERRHRWRGYASRSPCRRPGPPLPCDRARRGGAPRHFRTDRDRDDFLSHLAAVVEEEAPRLFARVSPRSPSRSRLHSTMERSACSSPSPTRPRLPACRSRSSRSSTGSSTATSTAQS